MKKFQIILFACFILSMFAACGGSDDNPVTNKTFTVRYEINGPETTATQVLYRPFLDIITIYDVPIPWQYSFNFTVSRNQHVGTQCIVSLPYLNSEMYTVKIFVNGNEVASDSGDFVVGASFIIIP